MARFWEARCGVPSRACGALDADPTEVRSATKNDIHVDWPRRIGMAREIDCCEVEMPFGPRGADVIHGTEAAIRGERVS